MSCKICIKILQEAVEHSVEKPMKQLLHVSLGTKKLFFSIKRGQTRETLIFNYPEG